MKSALLFRSLLALTLVFIYVDHASAAIKRKSLNLKLASSGNFIVEFDAIPSANSIDSVLGISNAQATTYSELAVAVRFGLSGKIDARNGSKYQALKVLRYAQKKLYHFKLVVRTSDSTYDIFVTPPRKKFAVMIGDAFQFRASLKSISALNSITQLDTAGQVTVKNLTSESDGTQPSPTPTATPTAKKTVIVDPTPPVSPTATPIVTPPVSTSKPGPNNTGPYDASALKSSSSITVTVNNTVIENVSVTGIINIQAQNVIVRNFKINADEGQYGVRVLSGSVTLQDGEITNAIGAAVYGNNWTAQRLNVHDLGADAFKAGGNNVLEDSWIHRIGSTPGAHADGVQIDNGENFVFKHNFFDMVWWDEQGGTVFRSNSIFFLNGYVYHWCDNVLIEDNWLIGGNYSIYALEQTNTRVINNRFGKVGPDFDVQYGLVNPNRNAVAVWSGNVDDQTGNPT